MEHLKVLRQLLDEGFIDPAEYEQRKSLLIDQLTNTRLPQRPPQPSPPSPLASSSSCPSSSPSIYNTEHALEDDVGPKARYTTEPPSSLSVSAVSLPQPNSAGGGSGSGGGTPINTITTTTTTTTTT